MSTNQGRPVLLGYELEPNSIWEKIALRQVQPGSKLLELGCGVMPESMFLALNLGCKITGVDGNDYLLRRLKKEKLVSELSVQLVRADLEEYQVTPAGWDVIICTDTLFLFAKSQARALLAKIKQGLAPNGLVYVYTLSVNTSIFSYSYKVEEEEDTYLIQAGCCGSSVGCGFRLEELVTSFGGLKVWYQEERDDERGRTLVSLIAQRTMDPS